MVLLKIKDFDPDYRETFGGYDIKALNVYSDVNNEKIGSVHDLLVDEQGHFRYFIVDLGFWGLGKKVLLPVGRSQVDSEGKHIYATGFTKDQAENLPEFNESLKLDNSYEERVRGVYRRPAGGTAEHQPNPLEASSPLEGVPPTRQTPPPVPNQGYQQASTQPAQTYRDPQQPPYPAAGQASAQNQPSYPTSDPNAPYNYQQDPTLYGMNDQHHSALQRFEERLRAKRTQPGYPRR